MARVLVVGPGAIGADLAARMARRGHDLLVAARSPQTHAALERHGARTEDPDGHAVQAAVEVVPEPQPVQVDLAVLATPCTQAVEACRVWLDCLGADVPVAAVQNGVLGPRLHEAAGDRLVEVTVAYPAERVGPGQSRRTGPGGLILGPWPGGRDHPPSARAQEVLSSAASVTRSDNMQGVKWTKLLINSCITTLGVITGHRLGELLKHRQAREAFLGVVREGVHVGRREGVRFEPVNRFHPARFATPWPGRHVALRWLGRVYGGHRSSSLQRLERGRATEIRYLNGRIVAGGEEVGVRTPVNAALLERVLAIENGVEEPGLHHLGALEVPAGPFEG